MTTFWRFIYYRLKSSALRTLIFTVIAVMIVMIVLPHCVNYALPEYRLSGLYMLSIILCVTSSLIPILELSGFKNRRNLDTLYFLPLGRKKLALAHFISGFAQVVVIYTVTTLVHFFYLLCNTNCFALVHMLPYYFLSLLLGFVIYAVYAFIFSQANTVVDGVVFCVLWIFLLFLVGETWIVASGERSGSDLVAWGILYVPMNHLTVLYQDLIEINNPTAWDRQVEAILVNLHLFVIWDIAGVAATIGYLAAFVKKGAEQAGEISDSWFGYKTLIPLYGCCFLIICKVGLELTLIPVLLYVIMMLVGYVIYRRGFKIKVSDLIVTGCGIILALIV